MIFQIRIETETPYQNLTHHADTRPPTTKFENPIEKKKKNHVQQRNQTKKQRNLPESELSELL